MCEFMLWQRRHSAILGIEDPELLGGWAWLLPEKAKSGKPAPTLLCVKNNVVSEEEIQMYKENLLGEPAVEERPKPRVPPKQPSAPSRTKVGKGNEKGAGNGNGKAGGKASGKGQDGQDSKGSLPKITDYNYDVDYCIRAVPSLSFLLPICHNLI